MSSNSTNIAKQQIITRICDPGQFLPRQSPDGYLETVTEWQARVLFEYFMSDGLVASQVREIEQLNNEKAILSEGNKQLAKERDECRERLQRENQLLTSAHNQWQKAESKQAEFEGELARILGVEGSPSDYHVGIVAKIVELQNERAERVRQLESEQVAALRGSKEEILFSLASILKLDPDATREAIIERALEFRKANDELKAKLANSDFRSAEEIHGIITGLQKECKDWSELHNHTKGERDELQKELHRLQHINSATESLRDRLAMAALPGLIGKHGSVTTEVGLAYEVADEALKYREA